MPTENNSIKKRNVTSRKRFETLKRDKFTCQYCGAKAPDVLLHVDHIVPFSDGGSCDLMNLVTSCSDCNGGKSDKLLSDDAAVLKSRNQAEIEQDRNQSIIEMAQWQVGLTNMDSEINAINSLLNKSGNDSLTEDDKSGYRPLIKKYGISDVLSSLSSGIIKGSFDLSATEKDLKSIRFAKEHPSRAYTLKKLNKITGRFYRSDSRYRRVKVIFDVWARSGKWAMEPIMESADRCCSWQELEDFIEIINERINERNGEGK